MCASNTFFKIRPCNLALFSFIFFIKPSNISMRQIAAQAHLLLNLPLSKNLALIPNCYVIDFVNTQQDNLIGFEGT
jgi:hypothetical protein